MHWKGPYTITHKQSDKDFMLDVNGKRKTFHANMLRKYVERAIKADDVQIGASLMVDQTNIETVDNNEILTFPTDDSDGKATIASVLNKEEKERIHEVLQRYDDVLRDAPGQTFITECAIKLSPSSKQFAKNKTENILEHFGYNTNLVKSHLNAWFASSVQNENRHFIVDGSALPSLVFVVFIFLDRNLFYTTQFSMQRKLTFGNAFQQHFS